ncbi:transcriptional regulators of sugar metabolism [Klebsiella pneumoniae]|nr:transcriptional regulators of sugar metabolism [Klebsiella pneumoniae]
MLDYAAFPQQRQALICQILQENGRVVCAELAARLQVSEHTIRRDLHELSREGFCKKVLWRGGAESAGSGGLQSAER